MIFYIDQSGSYNPNDPNEYFVIAAIAFQEEILRALARSIYNLNQIYWKADEAYSFELKGQLLLNPRAIKHPKNTDYANEILRLCRQQNGIAFAIIEERPTQEQIDAAEEYLLPRGYIYLFERINICCSQINENEKGILIFDSQDMRKNEILSKQIGGFFHKSKKGFSLNQIVPEPYFVSSNICYGIQLADLIAYIVGHKFAHRNELKPFYDQIKEFQFSHQDEENEYTKYGIKLLKSQQGIMDDNDMDEDK